MALGALSGCRVDAGGASDAGTGTGCYEGCHWDCFGGPPECRAGTVYRMGYGPRPCCGPGAGVLEPGWPICATSAYPCPSGACGSAVDPRYASYFDLIAPTSPFGAGALPDVLRLRCGGTPPALGASCVSDADCRPAPAGISRLACDSTAARRVCVEVPRPEAPAGFGATCGFAETTLGAYGVGERTVSACAAVPDGLCQVYVDDQGCRAQRCTMRCIFDEDCPAGTVCLGLGHLSESAPGYCAPATDRTTPAGRFGPTGCP